MERGVVKVERGAGNNGNMKQEMKVVKSRETVIDIQTKKKDS